MPTDAYDDIGDDDLVPLATACKIFLHGHLTKSSLRREHARGNLEIIRIANKDFVTRNIVRRMIERCTVRTDQEANERAVTRSADQRQGVAASVALKAMLAQAKADRTAEIAVGTPRAAAKACSNSYAIHSLPRTHRRAAAPPAKKATIDDVGDRPRPRGLGRVRPGAGAAPGAARFRGEQKRNPSMKEEIPSEISLAYDPERPTAADWHLALSEVGLSQQDYVLYLPTPEAAGAILVDEPNAREKRLMIAKLTFS